MFYARIKTADGVTMKNRYWYPEAMNADTWSPDSEIYSVIPFEVSGKTYAERKEATRQLAIDFQSENSESADVELSYGEIADIQGFFERVGRRFGLLREFRENAIC